MDEFIENRIRSWREVVRAIRIACDVSVVERKYGRRT